MQFGRGDAFWPLLISIGLLTCATKLSHHAQLTYRQAEPRILKQGDNKSDPAIGSMVPSILNGEKFPLLISVHTECQSCTLNPSNVTSERIQDIDFLNIASGVEKEDFINNTKGASSRRIIFDDGRLAEELNSFFTGRSYAYDKNRRLIYIQENSSIQTVEIKRKWNDIKGL